MSGINDLGKNYLEDYKAFGTKVLSENEQILKKSGVTPPVFNTDAKSNDTLVGLVVERTQKDDVKNNGSEEDKKVESFNKPSISNNSTLMDVRSSTGIMNTVYKDSIRKNNNKINNKSDSSSSNEDFEESLEELNGKDNNDDMAEFMSREYEKGLHLNGGGYVYYEKSDESTNKSVTANVMGSYKTENEKLTLSYGGSFEYEANKETYSQVEEDEQTPEPSGSRKSGNTVFMAKYKAEDYTFAVGETSNFYDNDTRLHYVYTGIMHNKTGIAATLIRKIEVTDDEDGKHIENKTNVKLHLLKPKKAEKQADIAPKLPSPTKSAQFRSMVQKNKQEVEEININKGYGFGMDLKLSSSEDADEYGVEVNYSSLLTKKSDENNVISITPYLGVYDYHPNSNEGLKIRTGIIGKLDSKVGSDLNISSQVIIDNKRIMRTALYPVNTFMVASDTTVSKGKFKATVSAGHINSKSEVKYYFITGDFEYVMKNSAISATIGYQDYSNEGNSDNGRHENKVFHTGLRYTVNF